MKCRVILAIFGRSEEWNVGYRTCFVKPPRKKVKTFLAAKSLFFCKYDIMNI